MTASPIADQTLEQVTELLQSYGSSLDGDRRVAIRALLASLEAGLTGQLERAYHLSAIDPGIGKTLSVATFLREWKRRGFSPESSVLVGVSRLEEIETYLKHAGLDQTDIAILTSVESTNAMGCPTSQHAEARVMFTTQQMIESRTKAKQFGDALEFHYRGQPRVLRIWDESLTLAKPQTLRVDDLGLLASLLRHAYPEFINAVCKFQRTLWDVEAGAVVEVPLKLGAAPPTKHLAASAARAVLEALKHLAGRAVTAVDIGAGDMRLAGSATPFPDDFAPVIILDASGRVRSTYKLWEDALDNLCRLPAAANDYRRLRVKLWERPVGKEVFKEAGTREDVVAAVVEAINDDGSDGDWVIVTYKDEERLAEQAIRKGVSTALADRLNFLTWGRHHGTNEFAHCRNVVIIGMVTYGQADYHALASAAAGGKPIPATAISTLKAGEYRHHVLQALTRASVRRSDNGVADACNAYVIASPGNGAQNMIPDAFPGCSIEPWAPREQNATGKAGELIAELTRYGLARADVVTKKELRDAIGVNPPNFARLLKHPTVQAYMDRNHLRHDRLNIQGWVRFEPWPGGWVWTDEAPEAIA